MQEVEARKPRKVKTAILERLILGGPSLKNAEMLQYNYLNLQQNIFFSMRYTTRFLLVPERKKISD